MVKPHAFVAMPFGKKPDENGRLIDFNRIYSEYILPALESAGLDVFRADQEQRAGEIRSDMFQELLIADLVVVDLTINNPNVWYELGVRHALRARGVVLVSGGGACKAFDLYTDRKLHYGIEGDGPDPQTLEADKRALTEMVQATMQSWHGRKISPVYHLMPNLREPDWKSLRIGDVREFWVQHDAWKDKIALARKSSRIGDILVLAQEAPVAAFRAEAYIIAGTALRKAEHFDLALEQLELGLAIDPSNLNGLHEKGICLQRLAMEDQPGFSLERARQHYKNVQISFPKDAESWALLGRVDKDAWTEAWRLESSTPKQKRASARYEEVLLQAAIESYFEGFRKNPLNYYSGINALTLTHLYRHLTQSDKYSEPMHGLAGAIRFAAECESDEHMKFWALATLGDLEVLTGTPDSVQAAYKSAIARSDNDWFALKSCRTQLFLLKELGFNSEKVNIGIETLNHALHRLHPPDKWLPRKVILFSGHMVDTPDRKTPRFPAGKEPIAALRIAEILERLEAGPNDLALTQGACGGDILFTEACMRRGMKVHWLQPYNEPEFIQKSVVRGGEHWRSRYYEAKPQLAAPILSAPSTLGLPPKNAGDGYPYERCNLWLLYTAMTYGVDKVHFVCLWDGSGGDGPGGTAHMYKEVNERTGKVYRIDSSSL